MPFTVNNRRTNSENIKFFTHFYLFFSFIKIQLYLFVYNSRLHGIPTVQTNLE